MEMTDATGAGGVKRRAAFDFARCCAALKIESTMRA